ESDSHDDLTGTSLLARQLDQHATKLFAGNPDVVRPLQLQLLYGIALQRLGNHDANRQAQPLQRSKALAKGVADTEAEVLPEGADPLTPAPPSPRALKFRQAHTADFAAGCPYVSLHPGIGGIDRRQHLKTSDPGQNRR